MIDLTADCIHQWKMNDNLADKVVVDSVGSNNGTSQTNTEDISATSGEPPYLTRCFNHSGAAEWFTLAPSILLAPSGVGGFAISFWAYGESTTAQNTTLCGSAPLADNQISMIHNSIFSFYSANAETTWTDDTDFYQRWRHVVLQYREAATGLGGLSLWLDAVEHIKAGLWTPEFRLGNIGIGHPVAGTRFNGLLDNFIVWQDSVSGLGPFILSQTDIDFLYNAGRGTESLIGYIDEGFHKGVGRGVLRGVA